MKYHESITVDRVMEMVEESSMDLSNPGICLECGEDADGCEPDARGYRCDSCGAMAVSGAEEILLMIA